MVKIPQVDFTSTNFAVIQHSLLSKRQGGVDLVYEGPQDTVQTSVTATSALGSIMPFDVPAPNSTWSVGFHGPSLECRPVNRTLFTNIMSNINTTLWYGWPVPYFLSWVPSDLTMEGQIPFDIPSGLGTPSNDTRLMGAAQNITFKGDSGTTLGPIYGDGPATIYVGVYPPPNETLIEPSWIYYKPTVLSCQLRNSSYSVGFDITNGFQTVSVSTGTVYNDVPASAGSSIGEGVIGSPTSVSPKEMEQFAYSSIMDSFARVLIGEFTLDTTERPTTRALSTSMADAKELLFMRPTTIDWSGYWNGSTAADTAPARFDLKDGLEEMFRNITVNLMTSPWFQYVIPV